MAKRFKFPKLNRSEKIATLGTVVSLGTAVYAISQSSASGSRSANVDGSGTINKDELVSLVKSNPELQALLRGSDGIGGAKGETGAAGQNANVANHTFLDGYFSVGRDINNDSNIIAKGRTKKFQLSNFNDVLTLFSMNNDDSGVATVMRVLTDGSIQKIGGGSFSAISDERLKQNIQSFDLGLEKILSIQTKSFNYKKVVGTQTEFYPDFICNKKQYGVIAQQLQEVCPEMVTVSEDGFLSVDLSNVPLMLINAVKELNSKIDDLEERLQRLENPTV